jgi:uncharacterized membrane protein YqhA
MSRQSNRLGGVFERFLWGSRLIMLVAVLTSVLLALGKLYLAVVDATRVVGILTDYADPSLGSKEATYLRNEAVASIVRTLDGFLITSILLIFAFGIYELFIGDIAVIDRSEAALRFLAVNTLDQLKENVARLVILVLVIEFFGVAVSLQYAQPLDLLYLAVGILLVSGGIFLTAPRSASGHRTGEGGDTNRRG